MNRLKDIKKELINTDKLLPTLLVGGVISITEITFVVALSAMLFSGTLSPYFSIGLGWLLLGSAITTIWVALRSSIRGAVSCIQDSNAAILVVIAVAIAQSESAPGAPSTPLGDGQVFYMVIAAIMLTTLLTGLVFWLLGRYKLGNIIRYVPYPVIGGFLAGSGVLLIRSAFSIYTGAPQLASQFSSLWQPDVMLNWIPGTVLAFTLLLVIRRQMHYLVLPGILILFVALFHGGLWMMGISQIEAAGLGLLQTSLGQSGSLWQPLGYAALATVNWRPVFAQAPNMIAATLVAVLGMLLNVAGIQASVDRNADLNQELRAAGVGNLLLGLVGCPVGYHSLGSTILGHRVGVGTRLLGLATAFFTLLILMVCGELIAYMPTALLGGLLLFLGLDFVADWLVETWSRLPRLDYFVIVMITLTINVIGFLEGVGLGLLLATLMFMLQYSIVSPVRRQFSGGSYYSRVERPPLYEKLLRRKSANWISILELQGFIFFGTVYTLQEHVRQIFTDLTPGEKPNYILFDFKQVTGIDGSAEVVVQQIHQHIEEQDAVLVLTGLNKELRPRIEKVVGSTACRDCQIFDDLTLGIEWCEDRMIANFIDVGLMARSKSALFQFPNDEHRSRLNEYLTQREFIDGELIIRQGDPASGIYFIEQGCCMISALQVRQKKRDAAQMDEDVRLRVLETGSVIGEMSYYLDLPATASVTACGTVVLQQLSLNDLTRMEQEDPELSNLLHRLMAALLSRKLNQQSKTLTALLN